MVTGTETGHPCSWSLSTRPARPPAAPLGSGTCVPGLDIGWYVLAMRTDLVRAKAPLLVIAFLVSACVPSAGDPSTPALGSIPTTPLEAEVSFPTTTREAAIEGTSEPSDPLQLVVVGDSIPFAEFCAGCEGFVAQYAASLEVNTGHEVEYVNRSRNDAATLSDINHQLVADASLRDQLARANVVIASVGFNDQAPWPEDRPCQEDGGTALATKVKAILQYSDSCIEETIESYRTAYESAFEEISRLAPEPRVLIALNVYSVIPGFPDLEDVASEEELDSLTMIFARILDGWNEMLCETASAHGFICVDIYGAFNGPEGTTPPGSKLGYDYTHPSQSGHDVIASLLREIDVSNMTGDY